MEPGRVVYTCNSSFQEEKAGGSATQGQSRLQSKFEASLGYRAFKVILEQIRSCLKK